MFVIVYYTKKQRRFETVCKNKVLYRDVTRTVTNRSINWYAFQYVVKSKVFTLLFFMSIFVCINQINIYTMASAKYGAIITDIKGKIGGTVFQGSVTGGVMKNNAAKKSTSGSSKLTKADAGRLFLPQRTISQLASAWRTLTAADILSWVTAAPFFPFLNKYGVAYTPSGYQLYMSVNSNLVVVGLPTVTVAPTASVLDNMPAFTLSWGLVVGAIIDGPVDPPAGYITQIYATVGMSAGRKPAKGDYKLIAVLPDGVTFPVNIKAEYLAVFGTPSLGATVWCTGKLTKADAGRNSQPFTSSQQVGTV